MVVTGRIACFGASVTEQDPSYCTHLLPEYEVIKFGYGSRQPSNAGYAYIDLVLSYAPEYCFIDWFSTGWLHADRFDEVKEFIQTLQYKFYTAGCKLIFLIFPDTTVDKVAAYAMAYKYLTEIGVPVLDISQSFDVSEVLRDGIHTTEVGGAMYAEKINEYFATLITKEPPPIIIPEKTKYCDVGSLPINRIIRDKIVFNGKGQVLGIEQFIGPFSGLISVNGVKMSIWDRWCYYRRDAMSVGFSVDGRTEVIVLQDDFDRSECVHLDEADFSVEKYLDWNTCFFIGNVYEENSI